MEKIEYFEKMLTQQENYSPAEKKSYSNAEWSLAAAYKWSREAGSDILILKDVLWAEFPAEMSSLLTKLDVTEICIAIARSSLLDRLEAFCNCGWQLKGMCRVPVDIEMDGPAIVLERPANRSILTIQLLRERACENEQWVDTLYMSLSEEEEAQYNKLSEGNREHFAENLLRTRIRESLINLDGWTSICRASKDYNWGDAIMDMPIKGVSLEQPSGKIIGTMLIKVNQDEHLMPMSIPALFCVEHPDGKVESSSAYVDFTDGSVCKSVSVGEGDRAYIKLENGDCIECDPEERYKRLRGA